MNPTTIQPAQTIQSTIIPTKSLLYWRKSPVNGRKCEPAILTLEANGTLVLKDNNNEGFSLPLSQVTAKFSSWGTMTLKANGKKYDFVGVAAPLSPSPSDALRAEMGNDYSSTNQDLTRSGAIGVAAGAVGGVIGNPVTVGIGSIGGVAMEGYAYVQGLEGIKKWESTFISAGLVVKKRKMRALLYFTFAIAGILILIILLAVIEAAIKG